MQYSVIVPSEPDPNDLTTIELRAKFDCTNPDGHGKRGRPVSRRVLVQLGYNDIIERRAFTAMQASKKGNIVYARELVLDCYDAAQRARDDAYGRPESNVRYLARVAVDCYNDLAHFMNLRNPKVHKRFPIMRDCRTYTARLA